MGKITAFFLLLMCIIQSPVFACALQTKADQVIMLYTETGSEQQDLNQSDHFDHDESDDSKLPVYHIGLLLPFHKDTKKLSGQYLLSQVVQQNFSIKTPPPDL